MCGGDGRRLGETLKDFLVAHVVNLQKQTLCHVVSHLIQGF